MNEEEQQKRKGVCTLTTAVVLHTPECDDDVIRGVWGVGGLSPTIF